MLIYTAVHNEKGVAVLVGYARVSTSEQETKLQRDALRRAGVRKVFVEKASAVGVRPVLADVMASLRPGDVLVVWKLDRLARSVRHLHSLLDELEVRKCRLRSLTEPIDTSSPLGEFVLQILGAMAQFERRLIRERAVAGQVAAYERGVRWGGRSPTLDKKQAATVRRLYRAGWTMVSIGEHFGVSRSTVSRVLSPSPPRPRVAMPVLREYVKVCVE